MFSLNHNHSNMESLIKYGLNTKKTLRNVLELDRKKFNKNMNLALEKFPDKFTGYSKLDHNLRPGMFKIICEHFGLSHLEILERLAVCFEIENPTRLKKIAIFLGLKIPKTDEEIARNFGIKLN